MSSEVPSEARALCELVDACPSPYHAARAVADRLLGLGFDERPEREAWPTGAGRHVAVRGGGVVAIALDEDADPGRGLAIVGAHTDSPNLRIKPRPDTGRAGWRQLGVEVYGGVLVNSWLDRDLGLSGRVAVRAVAGSGDSGGDGVELRLLKVDRPLLRVPQLAIHLDREVNQKGLVLDFQQHLAPVWGLGRTEEHGFRDFVAAELDVAPDDVLAWDVMCHDLTPSRPLGRDRELLAAPRLDNLASVFAGLRGFERRLARGGVPRRIPALAFFDHEEVGSASASGAAGPLLMELVERSVWARGGSAEDVRRSLADSICVSADMAHATHPNYADRHEPGHDVAINGGPVIKINANQRYASDAETIALFRRACEAAAVPFQQFVNRTNLACGSTIGPITAANLGLRTVDVGCPQLSMHSARELCGTQDVGSMIAALDAFFE